MNGCAPGLALIERLIKGNSEMGYSVNKFVSSYNIFELRD